MLGAGLQCNRSRGEDRFCNPKGRRNHQNQQKANYQQQQRGQSEYYTEKWVISRCDEPENRAEEAAEAVASRGFEESTLGLSNVERFVEAITPSVAALYLPKTTMISLKTYGAECKPYFVLEDLWESYKEWSAYGAGVPFVLNGNDSAVQYYVPYLSAIQLYVDPSKSPVKSRRATEDSDDDYSSRDSNSDGSSDSERDRFLDYSRGQRNHYQATDVSSNMDRLQLIDQQIALQEGFSSDDGESGNTQGQLLFQYLEHVPPYCREPLCDKIDDLAMHFPELKTLRSCDLTPSSWMSVAWYPIYRIPTGPTLKDLDACFLTYHSLYTQIRDVAGAHAPVLMHPNEMNGIPKVSLPVFGMASYKYRGSVWTSNNGTGRKLVNSLSQEAAKWLRNLQVHHPDHAFFSSR